ncbi:unnamed protein product [Adineta steineri]|uniref:Ubiquitin-like domain-containing protein n=1 Tax=Adineta steineri TaxID=433720 RepID=A0A814JKA8_9BILA|nr:unnamed protein product [Adineta steineri]
MIRECRLHFANDPKKLEQIDEFAQTYNPSEAIKWYTKDSFLFQIVNKVIRTQSSEIIGRYRLYIKDLEESLDLFFAKQTFDHWSSSSTLCGPKLLRVYRGQIISPADVKQLQLLSGQRIIMSQYTSTTKNINVAEAFAGTGSNDPHKESVIYEMDMSVIYESYTEKPDPTVYYYDISYLSQMEYEEEVLLRVGTVFQLVRIEKSTDGSWHVILRLEKVDDYRSAITVHRTPDEVVDCFFRKASQWRNINLENMRLSTDMIIRMSVFIRLGHLVRHHPREQLQYYQSALAIIPSCELALREVGYWAIRMRCISSVNDWTSVPVNIYRQTVFHVKASLRNQLNRELAGIEEARGAFRSAARYCHQILKHSNNCLEKQMMSREIERLNKKVDDLQPVLPPGQIAYWYLYVTVLTADERSMVDHCCKLFHQHIDKRNLSKYFDFAAILPNIDWNEYPELINDDGIEHIDSSSREFPIFHVFIRTVTDRQLEFDLDRNTTLRQLKELIRSSFDLPYPAKYDFRLIYLGRSLTDEDNSLYHYNVYDQCVMYVVHGPHIQDESMNRLERELYEHTGLNSSNMDRILAVARIQSEKHGAEVQKVYNMFTNLCMNEIKTSESFNHAFTEFFRERLGSNQYNEDEDADPYDLVNMSHSAAMEYIENSGPNISARELLNAFGGFAPRSNMEWNSDDQQHRQTDHDSHMDLLKQQIGESLSVSNCQPS